VSQFGEIQDELVGAVGDELIESGPEQVALAVADRRPSAEVEDGDVAVGFTN